MAATAFGQWEVVGGSLGASMCSGPLNEGTEGQESSFCGGGEQRSLVHICVINCSTTAQQTYKSSW